MIAGSREIAHLATLPALGHRGERDFPATLAGPAGPGSRGIRNAPDQ